MRFDNEKFNQFLFATGDGRKWLIAGKYAVTGSWYSNKLQRVDKSSINSKSHRVRWYRRQSPRSSGMTWLSLTDYHLAIATGNIVYGENSFSGNLTKYNGANVYVRMKGMTFDVSSSIR